MTTIDLACHDASCAPPPVGTGGSKPGGPSRGVLSPKASERKNPPQAIVKDAYEARKHGLREAFDGPIGGGLTIEAETQWVGDDVGWHIEGNLKNEAGDTVAYFERQVRVDQGKLVATHETLRVYEDFQGQGVAQRFNDHLVDWYQKAGVDRIEVNAGHEVGPYAWARQGYRIAGVEGGSNRYHWVDRRLSKVKKVLDERGLKMPGTISGLRNANNRDEDIQPIHIASLGQDDPKMHWKDDFFGDMWPGKAVLVSEHYQEDGDWSRGYDGVYYLEGRETPATVASALKYLSDQG